MSPRRCSAGPPAVSARSIAAEVRGGRRSGDRRSRRRFPFTRTARRSMRLLRLDDQADMMPRRSSRLSISGTTQPARRRTPRSSVRHRRHHPLAGTRIRRLSAGGGVYATAVPGSTAPSSSALNMDAYARLYHRRHVRRDPNPRSCAQRGRFVGRVAPAVAAGMNGARIRTSGRSARRRAGFSVSSPRSGE
jgi:hypothetical protein